MKRVSAIACVMCAASGSFAGQLTPPAGPVGSTPGPEPRIAINATNTPGDVDSVYRITQPGSYYLTENLIGVAGKSGIEIEATGPVQIDLMGYTLEGVIGSLDGIMLKKTIPTETHPNDISNGTIRSWGGAGVHVLDSVELRDMAIVSDSVVGCVLLNSIADSGNHIIHQSMLRTTEGPAISGIAMDGLLHVVDSEIVGVGCNTSSLVGVLLPSIMKDTTISVANSMFSGAVIECSGGVNSFWWEDMEHALTNTTADSALSLGMPGCSIRGGSICSNGCVYLNAAIEVTGENVDISDLAFLLMGTTTAPAGIRVQTGGVEGLTEDELYMFLCPGVPVGIDLVAGSSTIDGAKIKGVPGGGIAIRVASPGNVVQGCRIVGASAGAITGVEIAAGAGNNSVTQNVFVRLTGGTAVFNQGGASNAIGPIATAANIGAATNPFANLVH